MKSEQGKTDSSRHRRLLIRWVALWPLTAGLLLYPVSSGVLRVACVVMLFLLWVGALALFWRLKWLRMIFAGIPVLIGVVLLLPGQEIDRPALQAGYVKSLREFEGTRYVWGGENRLGIDCSGLVRVALINASIQQSARTLNPALLRFALKLWWRDCSARALGGEYRQQTRSAFAADAINAINSTRLRPGDLAVTGDGIHVLAFLGGNQWIEADPEAMRVLILEVPSTNSWFAKPVNIVRWRVLEGSSE